MNRQITTLVSSPKMEVQLDVGHNFGRRASMPFSEIETAAKEIGNRLAGLDMHFRALR